MIKEVIIVEGRDDVAAVKRAVEADIISTGGFALPPKTMEMIKSAAQKRGIIIFTDPDYAGEKIRRKISSQIKEAKHAFLPREEALKDGDIGIENASPANIIKALEGARAQSFEPRVEFTMEDLFVNGLASGEKSGIKRGKLGEILGIGYGNSKQFLNRLNTYGVTREEFENALEEIHNIE